MKFHYDVFYPNEYYSRVGGISVEEFNEIET